MQSLRQDSHWLSELFGYTSLWSPSTAQAEKPVRVLKNKVVLLYFSAWWCAPCSHFTPRLIQLYNTLKLNSNVDFEVVYCSLDKTEQQYKRNCEKMPWWCIPFGKSSTVTALLGRTYKVQGIPHLVVLDTDGSILVNDGVSEVTLDPQGRNFPWRPKPLRSILPTHYIANEAGRVLPRPIHELDNKYILLYFSAQWCPPCRQFTPKLNQAYLQLKRIRQDFEVGILKDCAGDLRLLFSNKPLNLCSSGCLYQCRSKYRGLSTVLRVYGVRSAAL